ncbi:MAG TPA: CocE/NonD family hydrolase [Chitinophagales bacterium]|nr:CocE/NonD family hydrolase [Chitinophagales bacterium]
MNVKSVEKKPVRKGIFKQKKVSTLGQYSGYSTADYRGFDYHSEYLEMRDGIKLAADICLPKKLEKDKKIPTVLFLTRYVRSFETKFPFSLLAKTLFGQITKKEIDFFTSYGYAVVIIDVRGTGASYGTRHMEFSPEEVEDGREIVDWIISQPWSNQKVGSTGISYLGTTAEMLLVNQHPNVKACIPRSSIFDLYNDIAFPGGVRHGKFIEVWRDTTLSLDKNNLKYIGAVANAVIKNPKPVKADTKAEQYKTAHAQHQSNFDIFSGMYKITFRNDIHPDLGRSINEFSVHHYKDKIEQSNTPIYRIGGWYDGALANSAIKGFLSTKNSVKLLVGPWDHGPAQHISPFIYSNKKTFSVWTEMLRFFDYHLKDIDNGIMDEPPISYYAMGKEQWRHVYDWMPNDSKYKTFLCSADNTLSEKIKNKTEGCLHYAIDKNFGTSGGARWNSLTIKYRYNRRIAYADWTKRTKNLLHFTSEPLTKNMELTGHATAEIYLSSDAKDVQLFVYISSVDKFSKATHITEGQFRGLHRKESNKKSPVPTFAPYHTFNKEDAMEWIPNKVEKIHFELIPTSHLIKKGERIRISIAGADADHFDEIDDEACNPASLQLFCTKEYPSQVHLPLMVV